MPSDPNLTDSSVNSSVRRDPEDRPAPTHAEQRDKMFDKTLADSFPTSDPPSTIPDPGAPSARNTREVIEERTELFEGLTPGSWVAISLNNREILGLGSTRDDAEGAARNAGHTSFSLEEVPEDPDAPLQAPESD